MPRAFSLVLIVAFKTVSAVVIESICGLILSVKKPLDDGEVGMFNPLRWPLSLYIY
jgi:hypothetical protein